VTTWIKKYAKEKPLAHNLLSYSHNNALTVAGDKTHEPNDV
jgi:hypothetical protein